MLLSKPVAALVRNAHNAVAACGLAAEACGAPHALIAVKLPGVHADEPEVHRFSL
jgi:hypothetical protein